MPSFLKGNYQVAKETVKKPVEENSTPSLTEQFEESTLARLGGSMCFVMKGKNFMWTGDENDTLSS